MKKWIALCLVLLLALSLLTACQNAEIPAETDAPAETPAAEPGSDVEADADYAAAIKQISSYTVAGLTSDDPAMQEVVAQCGNYTLTNAGLQIYYWMQFYNFMSSYGSYASLFGLDTTQPLSEQNSLAEGLSWEQYFLQAALEGFHESAAAATAADADGYSLDEEGKSYLSALTAELETTAASNGFESALAYVQESFGSGVTVEDYVSFVELYYYSNSYEAEKYDAIDATDAELEAYYREKEEDYVSQGVLMEDKPTVNVRHILITWEDADEDGTPTDEEKAAALTEAQRILSYYQTEATEEHFAELANQYSTDPGSNTNGGLYEGVYPGQMVEAFNDWCFDESRQPGDNDIVETNYGYHIMYFVGTGEPISWRESILDDYRYDKMTAIVEELTARYPLSVWTAKIQICETQAYG